MAEESSGTYEGRLSEFNSNKASLMRIDYLMRLCHTCLSEESYSQMYHALQSLKIEARYKMPEGSSERVECDVAFKKLRTKYRVWDKNQNNPMLTHDMEDSLEDFLEFLTDFMGNKGMLLRDADEEDYL